MSKGKHRAGRMVKADLRMEKHYILNQWHYFQKPKLKKAIKRLLAKVSFK